EADIAAGQPPGTRERELDGARLCEPPHLRAERRRDHLREPGDRREMNGLKLTAAAVALAFVASIVASGFSRTSAIVASGFSRTVVAATPAQERRTVKLRTLSPGDVLYVLLGGGGNTLALIAESGVVLIDTKSPGWGAAIREAVEAVTDQPVKTIVNTH